MINLRSKTTGIILIIVSSVMAFGAFLLLSAYAPMLRQGNTAEAHALSQSAIGYRAISDLMAETGFDIVRLRSDFVSSQQSDNLTIYAPPVGAFQELYLSGNEPALVVMPKWRAFPNPRKRGWAAALNLTADVSPLIWLADEEREIVFHRRGADAEDEASDDLPKPERVTLLREALFRTDTSVEIGDITAFQTISGEGLEPLWQDGEGRTVLARLVSDGSPTNVFLLSDPDLLNTQALTNDERTLVAHELLSMLSTSTVINFDLSLNGFVRPRNLITLIAEPPLVGVSIAVLAFAIAVGLRATQRFGPVSENSTSFARGKMALIDSTSQLLATPDKSTDLGQMYADHLVETLRQGDEQRAGQPAATSASRATFLAAAEQTRTSRNLDELMATAPRLARLKKKIDDER